jgi:hypothetical protein
MTFMPSAWAILRPSAEPAEADQAERLAFDIDPSVPCQSAPFLRRSLS